MILLNYLFIYYTIKPNVGNVRQYARKSCTLLTPCVPTIALKFLAKKS